jgi:hypothetical protein
MYPVQHPKYNQSMKLRRSADQTQPDPRAAAAQQAALRQLAAANVAPANQAAPTPKTSFAFIKDAEGNRYKIELVMPEGVKTLGFKADKQQWDQLGKSIFDAGLKAHLQDGPNVIEANAANGLCRINALDVEVHQAPEFVYNCWNIIDRSADEDRFYHQPVQNNNAPVNAQDNPADAAEAYLHTTLQLLNSQTILYLFPKNPTLQRSKGSTCSMEKTFASFRLKEKPSSYEDQVPIRSITY